MAAAYRVCLLATLALLAACNAGATLTPPALPAARPAAPVQHLYVMSYVYEQGIYVYSLGNPLNPSLQYVIHPPYAPFAMAVDDKGTLYALLRNVQTNPATQLVYVYPAGSTKASAHFADCNPSTIAYFGGSIYAAHDANGNCKAGIDVFAEGSTKPNTRITQGLGGANLLRIDRFGNVYVYDDTTDSFVEFPKGQTKPSRSLNVGIAADLASDSHANVFVSLLNAVCGGSQKNSIDRYAPGSAVADKSITNGICNPNAMTEDSNDTLYVVNQKDFQTWNVVEYSSGTIFPRRTITKGIGQPDAAPGALAVDSRDDLFVANSMSKSGAYGSIEIYKPGSSTPAKSIASVGDPGPILIGP